MMLPSDLTDPDERAIWCAAFARACAGAMVGVAARLASETLDAYREMRADEIARRKREDSDA